VIANDIHAVALPEVGLETIPDRLLYAIPESQIMISWQTCADLALLEPFPRSHSGIAPLPKENITEPVKLSKPELVPIFPVLLLRALVCTGCPFSSTVKQITEEDNGIRVEVSLYSGIGSPKIKISMLNGQGRERPWSARIGVRVYKLGVGDKD